MALVNNLKPQVDLPVWEWCKFAPTNTTAISSMTTGNSLQNRYLYYQVSAELYRYDTVSDSWNRLSNLTGFTTPTVMNNNVYTNSMGHYGQAIGNGGGNNTIQLAGLSGQTLKGYKIRIINGKGAGQERTITNVSAPIVHERGVVSTAGTQSIVDANTGVGLKQWRINRWVNYQFRCDFGTGRTQLRPILYNTINSLVWSDPNHIATNPWAQPLMNISVAVNSNYVIESHILTVDSNWIITPDATSKFQIMSGGIWNITQGTAAAPFFSLSYYDVIADQWYAKQTSTGLRAAANLAGSDLKMERFTEVSGAIVNATSVVSATARRIVTGAVMVPMSYANFEIRIVEGLGIGQTKSILSNTSSIINIASDWEVTPNATSKYEIWKDVGKIFLVGGNYADMLQYSSGIDQWTTGTMFENGECNQLAANQIGQQPFAITSITRVAGGITSLSSTPSAAGTGYSISDFLTITTGGTTATARVNAVDAVGGVTEVEILTVGTNYTAGAGKATTVSPAGGTGCTLNILAVDFTESAITPAAHNFYKGDIVQITGATGTGAGKFNGTYTILGTPTVNSFNYCSVGDPGAATATIGNTPSATQLVDCTKNWVVNEHVGTLVQFTTNAVFGVGQTRRIISNTATTLVWTLAATAPVNGLSSYVIQDIKPFGTEISNVGRVGGGTEGFATGGSTTTLVDNTKNWETNCWSKVSQRRVRIVEGTGIGSEIPITSNTATTLTFATQSFSPDITTRYVIMDTFGTATSGSTTTLVDTTKNWETNNWVGKRVRFLSGTSQGNEYAITSNTATTLNFGAGTAPDVSTAYAILESSPKAFGCSLDSISGCTDLTIKDRYLYSFIGTNTVEMARYNINTEHWELMSYFPQFELNSTGTMYVYDGKDRIYINLSTVLGMSGRLVYYDIPKNIIVNASTIPYGHSTVVSGNRMEIIETEDGLKYLYIMRHSGNEMWRILLFW